MHVGSNPSDPLLAGLSGSWLHMWVGVKAFFLQKAL